jgi:hypothetical protein
VTFDPKAKSDPFISIEGPDATLTPSVTELVPEPKPSQAAASQADMDFYDEQAKLVADPVRDRIFSELMLLEPPRWMEGLWVERPNGWMDTRTNTFFSFEDMRALVAQRIEEFGLDRALIDTYMTSPTGPWQQHERWRNSPIAERVQRFRRSNRDASSPNM